MTGAAAPAVELALALLRTPARVTACRERPLLHDVLPLIRIAAGDREATAAAAAATGQASATVVEAAVFFIQQVLFAPDSDSYRVLGVQHDWPAERIKEHYRWLMRWLHPDRNPDDWMAVFADRVNRAWQDLRAPERRESYDRQLAAQSGTAAPSAAVRRGGPAVDAAWRSSEEITADPPRLSARTVRRLPALILGGFSVLAGSALALAYYLQSLDVSPSIGAAGAVESVARDEREQALPPPTPTAAIPALPAPKPRREPQLPPPKRPDIAKAPAGDARKPALPTASQTMAHAPPSDSRPERSVTRDANAVAANPQSIATQGRRMPDRPAPLAAKPLREPAAAAPAVVTAAVAVAAPETQASDGDMPIAVLQAFRQAFADGDIARFTSLLSSEGGSNLARLERDYGKVFAKTSARRIEVSALRWQPFGKRVIGAANYEAWITDRDGIERHEAGDIRFYLVPEAGHWRIYRLDNEVRSRD